jgi:hypothetical protein
VGLVAWYVVLLLVGTVVLGIVANGIQRKCRIGRREIRAGRSSDKSKDYRFPDFSYHYA